MQPSHYSYSPRPVESNKSRQLSYVSSVIGTDEGAMRSSRLLSVGLTLFYEQEKREIAVRYIGQGEWEPVLQFT